MRRPVVILPRDLSPAGRAHFLRRFKVRAIVDWSPGALPWLEVPGVTRLLVTPSAGPLALLVAPTPPAPLPPGG